MNGARSYDPIEVALEEDEMLLVQVSNYSSTFLTTLDDMEIPWESITGCPWIQFELTSMEFEILMEDFTDANYDILV